jgi:hypothetical protein
MKHSLAAGALALALLVPTSAFATAQRTFVSVIGSDAQPCSVAQPCRSFAAAIVQTNAGGEVIALDSGGYGPVTIGKSVSIIAPPGVYAGVSVFSGSGLTVAAGASDAVSLRGLTINAQGGAIGIEFQSGGRLDIDRCTISGAFAYGIFVRDPLTPQMLIKETHVEDASVGITVSGLGGGAVRLTILDTVLSNVGAGIDLEAGGEVAIVNTRVIGHAASSGTDISVQASALHGALSAHVANSLVREFGNGVSAALSGASAKLTVASSELTHNTNAIWVNGATVALADSHFAHNNMVVAAPGGSLVYSSGSNTTAYNGSFGTPVTGPTGGF